MARFQNWISKRQRPTSIEDAILDYLRHGSDIFTVVDLSTQNEAQRRAIEMLSYSALFEVRRKYGVMQDLNENFEL